jgi:hypothetical protein
MTPRERFWAALSGEMPDRLPVTIWNNKLPGGDLDKQLLSLGVCVVVKSSVWQQTLQGVAERIVEEPVPEGSVQRTIIYSTPEGDLTTVRRIMPGTEWIIKFPFSGPEDFPALEALIHSRIYEPDYGRFLADDRLYGEQCLARPVTIHSPMHELIYEFMGIEQFSIQFAENRERLLHLCGVLKMDWQRRIQVVADSPARYVVIEGNTEIQVIGPERFLTYYLPTIQEGCEILHGRSKYAGGHFDGHNRKLAPLIARTDLDFVESFTPPPDCDMSVREAREIWPRKTLLVHFPSTVHHQRIDVIHARVDAILHEAAPGDHFVLGTSEDVPGRGLKTLVPLYRYIQEKSRLPIPETGESGAEET